MSPGEPVPQLQWIRPPVQGRSQRTLQKLLDATEKLLDQRPFERISVQEIVAVAGSSVGSFYARFATKEAVLRCLQDRYVAESLATADASLRPEAWAGVPLAGIVEALCAFMVGYQGKHRGLRRAILVGMVQNRALRRRATELSRYVTERMARLLETRRGEMDHPDPAAAADFIHRIIFAVLDQELIFGDEPATGVALTDDALVAELTRTCVAYLGVRTVSAAGSAVREKKR